MTIAEMPYAAFGAGAFLLVAGAIGLVACWIQDARHKRLEAEALRKHIRRLNADPS